MSKYNSNGCYVYLKFSRKSPKLNANVGNSTTSLVLALGIGAAILFWWRARRGKDSSEGDAKRKPRRSPFKFPDAKSSAPSSLPRNKSSNNKKNKARKHAEKQHRAEKRCVTIEMLCYTISSLQCIHSFCTVRYCTLKITVQGCAASKRGSKKE